MELAKRFNEAGRHGDVEAAFFQFVAEDVIATDFGDSGARAAATRGVRSLGARDERALRRGIGARYAWLYWP